MRIILSLLFAGAATGSSAQSFYVKVSGGYSFPLAAYTIGTSSMALEIIETDPETGYYVPQGFITKEKEVTGSMNAGPTISATVGYHFETNAAVELDMGYVSGKRYEVVAEERRTLDGEVQYARSDFAAWHSSNAFISPSLVLSTGKGLLKPYLKAGPLLALTQVTEETALLIEENNSPDLTQTKQEYSGNIALGLRGTAGLEMQVNERISLFSEVAFLGMQYAPKEKEVLHYEVNGEEQIGLWTLRQRKVTFVDRTSLNSRDTAASPDEPFEALKTHFGMSSMTALAGVKISL